MTYLYLTGVHPTSVHLMGLCLLGVYLTGRAPHGSTPHWRVPHRRVLYGRVFMFPNPKRLWEKPPDPPLYKQWSICRDLRNKIRAFALRDKGPYRPPHLRAAPQVGIPLGWVACGGVLWCPRMGCPLHRSRFIDRYSSGVYLIVRYRISV